MFLGVVDSSESITPDSAENGGKGTGAELVEEVSDKTKDTANDLENKQPEVNAGKEQSVRQMVDFDDASMGVYFVYFHSRFNESTVKPS